MKKYIIAITAITALSAQTVTASAEPYYVSVAGGIGLMNNSNVKSTDTATSITTRWNDAIKYKNGYAFEGAFGEQVGMIRGEIAVGYQSNKVKELLGSDIATIQNTANDILHQWGVADNFSDLSIRASLLTVMYNLYADVKTKSFVTPYLTGGLGATFTNMNASLRYNDVIFEQSYNKTVFAWQLGAGLCVKIANNMNVDLGYRYLKTGNIDLGSNAKLSFGGSKIMVGMQYFL